MIFFEFWWIPGGKYWMAITCSLIEEETCDVISPEINEVITKSPRYKI